MEGSIPSREAAKAGKSFEWIATTTTTLPATKIRIDTRVAVGIVELSLFVVREDLVGFRGLFEFFGSIFVVLT